MMGWRSGLTIRGVIIKKLVPLDRTTLLSDTGAFQGDGDSDDDLKIDPYDFDAVPDDDDDDDDDLYSFDDIESDLAAYEEAAEEATPVESEIDAVDWAPT